jgi:glycosyltransferase involved in cell wall biosynthesis
MNDSSPLISIIMPVYNGERYLSQAIESILDQTYKDFEIIAVDDGSTDHTPHIIESYPKIRYFFQTNSGPASAKNFGIKHARGEYFAFLDADDLWMPTKLQLQKAEFDTIPHLDIVTCLVEQFISPELELACKTELIVKTKLYQGFIPSAMLIRENIFNNLGLFFDSSLRFGEVIKWMTRVKELDLNINVLDEVLVQRRIHGNNLSILKQQNKNHLILHTLKSSLDRKRSKN